MFRLTVTIIFGIVLSLTVGLMGADIDFHIKGRIINNETNEPVFFVQVFLANTTIGTTTNQDGFFEIQRNNFTPGTYQLVIHHVAFEMQTLQLEIFKDTDKEFSIELVPKVWEGEEVRVVASDPREWKNRLETFLNVFIGESDNTKHTTLLNPEVLDFYIDQETNQMIARTDSVLLVENRALGYELEIILYDFRCSDYSREYLIYPRFKEKLSADKKQMKKWVQNREKAWYGSYRHFLRTIVLCYNPDLKDKNKGLIKKYEMPTESIFNFYDYYKQNTKYIVYPGFIDANKEFRHTYTNAPAPFEMDVRNNQYSLEFKGWLQIFYGYERLADASYIRLLDGVPFTMVDTLGNETNRAGIMKGGQWLREGISDLLPRDYLPKSE